jgi:hypothetical protein
MGQDIRLQLNKKNVSVHLSQRVDGQLVAGVVEHGLDQLSLVTPTGVQRSEFGLNGCA